MITHNPFSRIFLSLCLLAGVATAQPVALNTSPSRVIGQDSLNITSVSPNLVEGREFYQPQGLALDRSSASTGIYVADTLNNRVLGFRNAASFANGQKADVVLGQPDFLTTLAKGPGTSQVSGLDTPISVAVDSHGNVYVLDAANNRILRFPTPFTHSSQTPDLVIGQPAFDTRTPNNNGPSASSVSFTPGNQSFIASLAFDATGNLWVADVANYRVLRFPASALGSGATNGLAADLVLGQPNFTSVAPPPSVDPRLLTNLNLPTSLAFDPAGRLFVLESVNGIRGRVLVFTPPFATGKAASRVLGYDTSNPSPTSIGKTQFAQGPTGVFTYGAGNVGVVDTQNNRILLFNPVDQWTSDPYTQSAIAVLGQPDFNSGLANNGYRDTNATRLAAPASAVASDNELLIADSGNHRVVVLPSTGNTFGAATRVLGQVGLQFNAPNLVEGRELDFSTLTQNGVAGDAALAIDAHSNPPHLYIADPYNNRVLAFASAYGAKNGAKATFAIGQPDLLHTAVNYPNNNPGAPTADGLYQPSALVVDSKGNLYVADRGNGRVLRYPSPFDHTDSPQVPDLVLGESSFTSLDLSTTASTLAAPNGLALATDGSLLVSDILQNRVLEFAGPDFTNGMAAKRVFGQPDFTSSTAGSADNRLSNPYQIATDSSERLYVADAGNQRVLIFDAVTRAAVDPHALTSLPNISAPRGVFVNKATGEIWVTDAGSNVVLRYPAFDALSAAGNLPDQKIGAYSPRAVTVDPIGDLYVADLANRVAIYFRAVALTNGANFLSTAYGPGTFLSIFGGTGQFSSTATSFSTVPVPTTLADTQVLVNGVAAPVYYVQGNQINFLLPMSTPTSGTADIQVVRASTGQVLGAATISLIAASPGLFTNSGTGSGQVAALNQDNTVNGPDNPAAVGSVIQMFGTGQGFVPGAPPDGTPPTSALPTPTKPTVILNVSEVSPDNIQYSGLAPGLVGLWQVNVLIPASAVPPGQSSASVNVVLTMNNIPSGGPTLGRATTIWVKK